MKLLLVILIFAATTKGSSQQGSCTRHSTCQTGYFCQSISNVCKECSECVYNGDSVSGRCPTSRCPGTPVSPDVDTQAPELQWLVVEPAYVDVTERTPVYVSILSQISDDLSGYKWAQLTFTSGSQASRIKTYSFGDTDLTHGTSLSGWYETVFWFEAWDEGGFWQLSSLILHDRASNWREYGREELRALGRQVNSTFVVEASYYIACRDASFISCDRDGGYCINVPVGDSGQLAAQCTCLRGFEGDGFTCIPAADYQPPPDPSPYPSPPPSSSPPASSAESEDDDDGYPSVPHPAVDSPDGSEDWWTAERDTHDTPKLKDEEEHEEPQAIYAVRHVIAILVASVVAGIIVQTVRRNRRGLRALIRRRRHSVSARIEPTPGELPTGWVQREGSGRERVSETPMTSLSARRLMVGPEAGRGRLVERLAERMGRRGREEGEEEFGRHAVFPMPAIQPPPPVALPAHLLPGAVVSKEACGEDEECVICMMQKKNATLMPCGHEDLCQGCAEHILSTGGTCPICRAEIHKVAKTQG